MKKFFTIFMMLVSAKMFCQVGGVAISPNGSPPDPSAILDLNSATKGMLVPRLTTGGRDSISNPAASLFIYNTTTNCFEAYAFGNWQAITCLCSGPPSAPGAITGDTSPCSGATNVVYTAVPVSGATSYTWTAPSGASIIAGQGTTSVTINFSSNPGNVTVSANNNCGTSDATIYPVNISTIPATPGTISGNTTTCAGSTTTYSISAINGASTYTWAAPAGTVITGGQGSSQISVLVGSTSGNISVTAGNGCGTSSAGVLGVTALTVPATPGSITGGTSVCANSTGNIYSINSVSEANSYNWAVAAGTFDTLADTSISVSFGGSPQGTITVSASNTCGTSSASSISVSQAAVCPPVVYTSGSQTFTVPAGVTAIQYLIVAGGGGGAEGGGGAGGFLTGNLTVNPADVYTVIVGAGGTPGNESGNGSDGNNSSFAAFTAIGGGGGGEQNENGLTGGSGGGGGAEGGGSSGGAGTNAQGNNGGNGLPTPNPSYAAGGGGGAGGVGGTATGDPYTNGAGGQGLPSNISGSTVYYAGGGGGGNCCGSCCNIGGPGGTGGGGGGSSSGAGTPGTPNTGGGGGGGYGTNGSYGGTGGSGIVILSW